MFLCKNKCEKQEDVIIETDSSRAQSGRFSLEYREGSLFGLYVTISQATTSETGGYMCGYGRALSPDTYYTVRIMVIGGELILSWR